MSFSQSQLLAIEKPVGHVLAVNGPRSTVGLFESDEAKVRSTVGKLLEIQGGKSTLIGIVTDVSIKVPAIAREKGYCATAKIDLMGEIKLGHTGASDFERGVANYPVIGDPASL